MPAKQKAEPATQISKALAREDAAEREAAMRQLCSSPPLSLWKVCRGKRCRRLKTCAGNADACFTRHWPRLTADVDLLVHAHFKTGAAGIVRPEIAAELERRLRLDMKTKASEPAPQASPVAAATSIARAPNPQAPSPRLRVL